MAEMIIILRRDPQSGKQNIYVKLESDADALPVEHEQLHKKLVEKLIGTGINPDELGEVIVEREAGAEPVLSESARPERVAQQAGQGT